MNIKEKFGVIVKKYRLKLGFSQEKLGEISGLHRTYISEIERGLKNVSIENIEKIAVALNIPISDLFK